MHNDEENSTIMLARIDVKVGHIENDIRKLEAAFDHYTKLARFLPVERAVFGIVGIIAVALVGIAIGRIFGAAP